MEKASSFRFYDSSLFDRAKFQKGTVQFYEFQSILSIITPLIVLLILFRHSVWSTKNQSQQIMQGDFDWDEEKIGWVEKADY